MVAYRDVMRTDLSGEARMVVARRFWDVVHQLDDDEQSLPPFWAAFLDDEEARIVGAARALVSTKWISVTERLLHLLAMDESYFDESIVRQLGKRSGFPPDAWDVLDQINESDRAPMVAALLYRPEPEAERRWYELLEIETGYVVDHAIAVVARWGRPELLQALLAEPRMPIPKGLPPELRQADIRATAAFYLALTGDSAAIEFLVEQAESRDVHDAANACRWLAALGLPAAVAPIERILRGRDEHAAGVACAAAWDLGSPLLAPALCALVEAARGRDATVADQATRALGSIAGADWRDALASLDPSLRYHDGAPITFARLVDDLLSDQAEIVRRATFALQAMSGDDLGLESEGDLLSNLDGIEAWRARVQDRSRQDRSCHAAGVAEVRAAEPGAIEPGAIEPGAIEPVVAEVRATEPGAIEPVVAELRATEPDATEPDATTAFATEPGAWLFRGQRLAPAAPPARAMG